MINQPDLARLRKVSTAALFCAASFLLLLPREAHSEHVAWYDDYPAAYARAKRDRRMLLIYFRDERQPACGRFEAEGLADAQVRRLLDKFVRLRLAIARTAMDNDGDLSLLAHASMQHMRGRAGLAIIDLAHQNEPYYGHVVSCLPFVAPKYDAPPYEGAKSVTRLLRLPAGTLTQRSMVYAVRCHAEQPASTRGSADSFLFDECEAHCRHQARLGLQGHHGWDARFQRISARLQAAASEVCAESWPGEPLVEACFSCVHAWRQSPGHWNAVSAAQTAYGYDIRRGENGIWYATGIFAGRE